MRHIEVGSCSHDVVFQIGVQKGLEDTLLSLGQCCRCNTSLSIDEKYALSARLELHKQFTDLNRRAYTIHDVYVRVDKPYDKEEPERGGL